MRSDPLVPPPDDDFEWEMWEASGGYAEYLDARDEEYIAEKIEEAEKG